MLSLGPPPGDFRKSRPQEHQIIIDLICIIGKIRFESTYVTLHWVKFLDLSPASFDFTSIWNLVGENFLDRKFPLDFQWKFRKIEKPENQDFD